VYVLVSLTTQLDHYFGNNNCITATATGIMVAKKIAISFILFPIESINQKSLCISNIEYLGETLYWFKEIIADRKREEQKKLQFKNWEARITMMHGRLVRR
jgi:hypothetical protein